MAPKMHITLAFLCSLALSAFSAVPCPDDKLLCSDNAKCTFELLKFACECKPGFSGDGSTCNDIDECATLTDSCDNNAFCRNTPGSYDCHCNLGFTGDGIHCTDIDECSAGTDDCDSNATCINFPGGFSCKCELGFSGNGKICDGCLPGFQLQGKKCVDIDECKTNPCVADASCSNSAGSYVCYCNENFVGDGKSSCLCPAGFNLSNGDCLDIDECLATPSPCDVNAACENTKGAYTCTCNSNFIGNGTVCEAFNVCDTCKAEETCAVTDAGVKECVCSSGYKRDTASNLCMDIDECKDLDAHTLECSSHASCVNSVGSFQCVCSAGYTGTGMDCLPVDFFTKKDVVG